MVKKMEQKKQVYEKKISIFLKIWQKKDNKKHKKIKIQGRKEIKSKYKRE